jgi:uncharacterized protein YceK
MFIFKYNIQKISVLSGLIVVIFMASGCGSVLQILTYPEQRYHAAQEQKLLKIANDTFRNGAYRQAGEYYDELIRKSDNPEIRRRSIFGLANVRFALAQDCDDLDQAYDLWFAWKNLPYNKGSYTENPRMLDPILEKIASCGWPSVQTSGHTDAILIEKTLETGADADRLIQDYPEPTEPPAQTVPEPSAASDTKHPVENIEKLIIARNKEIRRLRNQILKMETEMRSLRQKISALEEIHQEIQEKKKGILR